MKKLLSIIVLIFICTASFAQKADSIVSSSKKNLIYIDVPPRYKINDKIILRNNSPYVIIQAVVVMTETEKVLGSTVCVKPKETSEMASFEDNGLRIVRGKRLALKVKGVKKILTELTDFNNIDPSLITYEFNASVSEEDHDLYITITSGSTEDSLDF